MNNQKKAGRPKLAVDDKRVNINLSFTVDTIESMKAQAVREGFTTKSGKPRLSDYLQSLHELN